MPATRSKSANAKRKTAHKPAVRVNPDWQYFDSKEGAMAYKRLMEAEKGTKVEVEHALLGYREGGWKKWRAKVANAKNHGKRNPESEAAHMFEKFHGEPSENIVEFVQEEHYHGNLAECGLMLGLKVRPIHGRDITIGFDEKTGRSVVNPKGMGLLDRFMPARKFVKVQTFKKEVDAQRLYSQIAETGGGARLDRVGRVAPYKWEVWVLRSDVQDVLKKLKKRSNAGPIGEATKLITRASSYVTERGPLAASYKAVKSAGRGIDNSIGRVLKGNPDAYGPALLCTNEAGTQLYIHGGDQSLDLKSLKIPEKDSVIIGEAWAICYRTAKKFDDFQEIDYVHGFGEEKAHPRLRKNQDLWEDAKPPEKLFGTGELPTVRYDVLNQRIHLDGGVYKIKKPLFGVSPGIEN